MNGDLPTSVVRKSKSGGYSTTIPREAVEETGITDQDRIGIRPVCTGDGLALELDLNPKYQGANVVSVKMQGPRNRQAVLRPPRRFAAVLRLGGVTLEWDATTTPLRATLHREPLLNPGYLGAFENATSTSVVQRGTGTYLATLPTRKVREVGFEDSEQIRVWFECLRGVPLLLLSGGRSGDDRGDLFKLQMTGPRDDQPRITVTRALGDALRLAGKPIQWVVEKRNPGLLGRIG